MSQILKVKSNIKAVSSHARKVLLQGGVIAFPTDTFYGLGVDPFNQSAVDRVFKIKSRNKNKPLFLLVSSRKQLETLVKNITKAHYTLMKDFWPGPLTLLFEPRSIIPKNLSAGQIGIRQPGNSMTRDLIAAIGQPITAPSANIEGETPPTTAKQVNLSLGKSLDLIIDGGTCPGGKPSTLLDLSEATVQLIRPGAIPFKNIELALRDNTKPNSLEVLG